MRTRSALRIIIRIIVIIVFIIEQFVDSSSQEGFKIFRINNYYHLENGEKLWFGDDVVINIISVNSKWKICFFLFFFRGEKLLINVKNKITSQVHKNVTYSLFLGPGIIIFCKKKMEILFCHIFFTWILEGRHFLYIVR